MCIWDLVNDAKWNKSKNDANRRIYNEKNFRQVYIWFMCVWIIHMVKTQNEILCWWCNYVRVLYQLDIEKLKREVCCLDEKPRIVLNKNTIWTRVDNKCMCAFWLEDFSQNSSREFFVCVCVLNCNLHFTYISNNRSL